MKTPVRFTLVIGLGLTITTPGIAQDVLRSIEAVSSQAPGIKPMRLQDISTMLDTITGKGERLLILKGTRKAGTRAAVHIHPYAGHTCVISGTITALMEGRDRLKVPAGQCFYMPANVPMAAANLETEDAVLIDTFIIERNQSEMKLLENYP